jgi:hypothetical protein
MEEEGIRLFNYLMRPILPDTKARETSQKKKYASQHLL